MVAANAHDHNSSSDVSSHGCALEAIWSRAARITGSFAAFPAAWSFSLPGYNVPVAFDGGACVGSTASAGPTTKATRRRMKHGGAKRRRFMVESPMLPKLAPRDANPGASNTAQAMVIARGGGWKNPATRRYLANRPSVNCLPARGPAWQSRLPCQLSARPNSVLPKH